MRLAVVLSGRARSIQPDREKSRIRDRATFLLAQIDRNSLYKTTKALIRNHEGGTVS